MIQYKLVQIQSGCCLVNKLTNHRSPDLYESDKKLNKSDFFLKFLALEVIWPCIPVIGLQTGQLKSGAEPPRI
jgi:hypothetical protein